MYTKNGLRTSEEAEKYRAGRADIRRAARIAVIEVL